MTVEAVLSSHRGLIVAPAGCGKTHLITETLNSTSNKPFLVLTHTTAGVAALKSRLKRLGVPNYQYVVATIDGWALRISTMFPGSCNVVATPDTPKVFYPELRRKVNKYIDSGHISDLIQSTYSRLLVDEYQDCNSDQHALICSISEFLPTIVFGDPMQCIFNFSDPMPCWVNGVQARFPIICELNTPWRWINAGTPNLGRWIINCRNLLNKGNPIDLLSCPEYVQWHQLTGNYQTDSKNQIDVQYQIRKKNAASDSLLIIGNPYKADLRHRFASTAIGIDVVEPVDLKDILNDASKFDTSNGVKLASHVIDSVSTMMTGIRKEYLLKRVATILASRNRTPATALEIAVKCVVEQGDNNSIDNLLSCLELCSETRIYRKGAFSALKSAVSLSIGDSNKTIRQSAEIIREQRRHQGDRRIPTKAIGSTLLLKGLEADHVFILDADGMNSHNLYVALSRGAKSITVFSNKNILP
ncbi:MAG: ATP-dependent helicase [Bacteroidetes bacterium]|nr:ATP-dependent helicase [Bacteroidota bacterium]